jgi:PLP dependent protein
MKNIAENLAILKQRIYAAEQKYGRSRGSVRLLAVSKSQATDAIMQAIEAGQLDFGENYLQEALAKVNLLEKQRICWHFIGPIQSNKTRLLAENFDWIHSLDRERTARRLSEARPADRGPINICIQVNICGEATKSGISPSETTDFAKLILGLPGLCLRGLMVIPAIEIDFERQKRAFGKARELYGNLQKNGIALDTLSMGMSGDLEAAIAEGSTMVRIGTAIFGARHT